ncbi:MAG: recombinase zinc beta ribbon domain-containing protein [Armatimonadota bacterium]
MHIYRILHNRTYLGEVIHKDKTYPGEHEAIVTKGLWEQAHAVLETNRRQKSQHVRAKAPALLKGIIRCAACDRAMSPVSTTSGKRAYRYYQCGRASKEGHASCPVKSVSAGEIEAAVIHQLRAVFSSPEVIAQTFRATQELEANELEHLRSERRELETRLTELKQAAGRLMDSDAVDSQTNDEIRRTNDEFIDKQHSLHDVNEEMEGMQARLVDEREVAKYLRKLDPIWEELYPLEQCRIVQLLIEEVSVGTDGMNIRIRSNGIHSLISELKDTADKHDERTHAI